MWMNNDEFQSAHSGQFLNQQSGMTLHATYSERENSVGAKNNLWF
jgi:hypothetical protein